ncbi:SHOCT domain-containing protein [Nonomuraea sp. M3C6]|uniref:SHOCT domain-containing protein n=2 Tax=Nonomuraea marmarensis TaxID=3351344 RepID=A0ABW7AU77_9ACTN
MIFWVVLGLALLGLAVAAVVWLVRSLTRDQARPGLPAADAAHEELRRRYAAGEIDREQYLQAKVDLER